MTLFKLSLRNARRQALDYLVYFVTVALTAALMYAFNGLVFSEEIMTLSSLMASIPIVVIFASIAVICILGWLVSYTTGFMLSRRSRELGTYILIGLENAQVARLFFLENLAAGGAALALGLVSGGLVYQVLRAVVLSMFDKTYTFSFTFSLRAIGLTFVYFLFIYLSAQFRIRRRIRKMKIYDLIYFERQNEKEVIEKSKSRRVIFSVSIVLGILGTVLLMLGNLLSGLIGAACVILFLYGFFLSFSSGVPAWFDRHLTQKYSRQNLLVYRSLTARLATMGVTMATISLLFAAVLMTLGSGMTIGTLLRNRAAQSACFDLHITCPEERMPDYLDCIEANDISVTDSLRYPVYIDESAEMSGYFEKEENLGYSNDCDLFLRYSDYAALRAMLGFPEATLEPGTYIIHCPPYLGTLASRYGRPVTLGGTQLAPGPIYTEMLSNGLFGSNGEEYFLVVPDEALDGSPIWRSAYTAITSEPLTESQCNALFDIQDNLGKLETDTADNMDDVELDSADGMDDPELDSADSMDDPELDSADSMDDLELDSVNIKAWIENEAAASSAIFVFPLYYLALVLTMTAAAILTVRQLSEARRYRHQFRLLGKLGMDRREMERALRLQFSIYYAMPAVPPLLIGVPFILGLGGLVEPGIMVGASHPMVITGITLGLFLLIYFIYILLAYGSMKRNVLDIADFRR